MVEVDGMMYALGGNDGSASLNSVERYYETYNNSTESQLKIIALHQRNILQGYSQELESV